MQKINFFSDPHKQGRILILMVTLASLAAVFVLAYLGIFSRLMADDYCTAGKLNQLGFWSAQSFWYNQWSGRFAFTLIISLFEQAGAGFTTWAPLFGIVLFQLTAYLLVKSLIQQTHLTFPRLYTLFLSSLVVFLTLFSTPDLGQTLFWMTGMATYLLPVIFAFRLFSLLVDGKFGYAQHKPVLFFLNLFLILLLAWFVGGFSEIATAMLVTILALGIFYKRFLSAKKSWSVPWMTALIGSLVGLGMLFFAPGNTVRQASGFTTPGLFSLMIITAKSSLTYLVLWLMKNAGLVWSAGFITLLAGWFIATFHKRDNKPYNAPKHEFLLLFLSALIVFVVSFLPSGWALSNKPPDRALILPTVILTLSLVWTTFRAGFHLQAHLQIKPSFKKPLLLAAAILSAYFILSTPLYQTYLVYENKPVYAAYAQAWKERETEIRQQIQSGKNQLMVSPLPQNPLGLEELTSDASHWVNVCLRDFYGVQQIQTK